MSDFTRTRKSPGQSSGGQFSRHDRTDDTLSELSIPQPKGLVARLTLRDDLNDFAQSPNPNIRAAVAVHRNAYPEARALLAFDAEPAVRAAVASAPLVENELLRRLANDFIPEVRRAVARRDTADLLDLWRLLHDTDLETSQNASRTLDALGYESTRFDLATALAAEAKERLKETARLEPPRYGVRTCEQQKTSF